MIRDHYQSFPIAPTETVSFKSLSPTNWTEADPVSAQFWRESSVIDRPVEMDGDAWAREFLAVELKQHVPLQVRELFAVARGALLYGWFFYPMFRLGEEQLHRVVEAAVKERYRQTGGSAKRLSLEKTIKHLVDVGVIPDADEPRWHATRELRNVASHPHQQAVMPPGVVLTTLKATAHDINRLFAREPRASP